MSKILITGGAGFVGSNLAVRMAERHPGWHVVALDNLHRKGSELNLERLDAAGVEFVRGDVREPADLEAAGEVDFLIECSAEPSVMSGIDGDTSFLVHTNLTGAYNCLELARRHQAGFVFLSTSRVYPMAPLTSLALEETETRFELRAEQPVAGVGPAGVSEEMPLAGARTLYGTTKLAAELLVEEYREVFGLRAAIDRFGVIAGPWQMGKVDQGVFSHWLLSHVFERPLSYIGFGGEGKQVRDLLHVEDAVDLIDLQLADLDRWDGAVVNVGGGRGVSLSLLETTGICRELTGVELPIGSVAETRPGDVPVYVSDCARLESMSPWRPRRGARQVLEDIHDWILADPERLGASLGLGGRR